MQKNLDVKILKTITSRNYTITYYQTVYAVLWLLRVKIPKNDKDFQKSTFYQ